MRGLTWNGSAAQRADVVQVLDGMVKEGALDVDWPARTIEVLNKADLLGGPEAVPVREGCIAVSAITGEGLASLSGAIDDRISAGMEITDYLLPAADGARVAWLYQHGEVIERRDAEDGVHMVVRMLPADRARFERGA
ncbi:MAG: hypothetical protein NVS2B11_17620 [Acetobacteraceae bacterium]